MKKLLFSLIIIMSLIACTTDENSDSYKPNSIGTQGRIDVIMPEILWKGRFGNIVQEQIAPLLSYYPNEEYLFDVAHSSPREFGMGSKKQKNILEFEITLNPKLKPGISYSSDIWARDQSMVTIMGKSQQDLYDIFTSHSQEIQDHFIELEIERMKINLIRNKNFLAETDLLKKHKLSITVPNDMQLSINNDEVAILERRRLVSEKQQKPGDLQEFIVIYHYPYTDKKQFNKEALIAKRDSIVGKYFKGKSANSYMQTADTSLAPSFEKERLFKNTYAYEIRGLYSMVNGFRGGPFINISLVDEDRGRIVTIEAHLYGPKFAKRTYMMGLETMLNTLSFE
ncbi:MAG: DUF4837 family protein [Flavobacteriales bacterium]